MSNHFLDLRRHSEIFNAEEWDTPIHVIGAGATGSWLVLMLAKLGIKGEFINVWDFDEVESHNIPNQLFGIDDVGSFKVQALYESVKEQTKAEIAMYPQKYERQRLSGFVFLMVDSMAERKRIWETSIKMKSAVKHLVEPRMGLNMSRIYNVTPMDMEHIKRYEDTYYDDDEAEVSACGTSITVVTSAISTASACVRQLINYQNDTPMDNEILTDYMYNNMITERW